MKYIQKGQENTFTIKINQTYSAYSGSTSGWTEDVYYFDFFHIQSQIYSGVSLTDFSDKQMVFSKFILESGTTNDMSSGQYLCNIYEDETKSVLITTEYFQFEDIATNNNTIYNSSNEETFIYK